MNHTLPSSAHLSASTPTRIRKGLAIGAVCFFGSYWLVLWVYQLGRHASYVVAFRQFSIIIGVVIAFVIYKDRIAFVQIAGIVLITVGLIFVGLFGNS